MRWPWRRRHTNGEAKQAIADAESQHIKAHQLTPEVERKVRAAEALTRRGDRFAREIERSWHLKRGSV